MTNYDKTRIENAILKLEDALGLIALSNIDTYEESSQLYDLIKSLYSKLEN